MGGLEIFFFTKSRFIRNEVAVGFVLMMTAGCEKKPTFND